MTPRRKQTNTFANEPVRFYKLVALSFLFLTIILLAVIVFMSTKRATITVVTRPEPVNVSTNLVIEKDSDLGKVTEVEVSLNKDFKPTSTKEEPAVATGFVTLYNDTNFDQPLVATTRLLTADGVLFRMKNRATVPANGTVDVEVYADKEGKDSEIGPSSFTIPGLSVAKQEVIYASSVKPMVGGFKSIGILTKDNLEKATKEMLEELKEFGAEEMGIILDGEGVAYEVVNHEIIANSEVGDEIDNYVLVGTATVIAVTYDEELATEAVSKELDKRVLSDVEVVTGSKTKPTVSLEAYDIEAGTATLKVFCSGLVELNPESKQLQKMVFFGKTRDEVRRYLLSLDHVQGVEIKFSPAWMRSVPYVNEHVNVIVKSVE